MYVSPGATVTSEESAAGAIEVMVPLPVHDGEASVIVSVTFPVEALYKVTLPE
jgi:hypothetical protein